MWRFVLRESGRLALGLFGALLTAAAISALSVAGAGASIAAFTAALAGRLLAFVQLDFGTSAISGLSATQELVARGYVTLTLVLMGGVIAFLLGVPLGLILTAGPLRRATAPLVQIVSAVPVFCAGLALAFAAHALFGWSMASANFPLLADIFRGSGQAVRITLLPALTVGLAGMAATQVALRRSAADLQDEPFRAGLRRLGLSALEIDRVYVAPLVLAGFVASFGEIVSSLLSAAVVSEWVFRCPGIADLFVKSVALHDWNVVAPILFFFASIVLVANFLGRLFAELLTSIETSA